MQRMRASMQRTHASMAACVARPHVKEVRPGAREHAHARLCRDGLCQQRLAGAGRTSEHHAADARDATLTQQRRVLEVVDDLRLRRIHSTGAQTLGTDTYKA